MCTTNTCFKVILKWAKCTSAESGFRYNIYLSMLTERSPHGWSPARTKKELPYRLDKLFSLAISISSGSPQLPRSEADDRSADSLVLSSLKETVLKAVKASLERIWQVTVCGILKCGLPALEKKKWSIAYWIQLKKN